MKEDYLPINYWAIAIGVSIGTFAINLVDFVVLGKFNMVRIVLGWLIGFTLAIIIIKLINKYVRYKNEKRNSRKK